MPVIPAQRQGDDTSASPTPRTRRNRVGSVVLSVVAAAGLVVAVLLIGPALSPAPVTTNGNAGDTLTVGQLRMTASPLTARESMFGPTLCSTVTYRNVGSSPESIDAMYDWKLRNPSARTVSTGLLGTDTSLAAGQLAGGRTTTGEVCFDRTAAESGRYLLQFAPMGFSAERAVWTDQVG
ncbi:hypothetical protein EV378_2845 [Pseudonocardia endophytica]|uniref:DUF4352 domain-containing protein n=2 Tax=Pseudonocardia endophytica TaxID=401976 RepID=A0A4R1I0G0_PSEEN|nr:hypothetical protein EV378_2845 [Pseudonocardia endophytica]